MATCNPQKMMGMVLEDPLLKWLHAPCWKKFPKTVPKENIPPLTTEFTNRSIWLRDGILMGTTTPS